MDEPRALRRWLAPRLLAWFDLHRRDLPWRADRDAYRILVSEVMLQQTQVATVIERFLRFVERWPTLAALAAAEEQDVLRLWQGLGYYRRARDLLRAAKMLHERHGGIPDDPAALEGVPGLGEYTRNAVLSQAFDRRLPILEANSQRVLSRLFGKEDDPRGSAARRWLWDAAEAVLPAKRAGDFNQALMELGALVCTATAPRCLACPVSARCEAFRTGRQDEIPLRDPPPEKTMVREVAVMVRRGGKMLLAQRPAGGRWAGLWEFPRTVVEGEDGETAGRLLASMGIEARLGRARGEVRHGITRFVVTVALLEAEWVSGEFRAGPYAAAEWLAAEELGARPASSPQRRLAALVI